MAADVASTSQCCHAQTAVKAAKAAQKLIPSVGRQDTNLIPDRQADRRVLWLQPPGRHAQRCNPAVAVARVVLTAEAKGGQSACRGATEGSGVRGLHLHRGVKTDRATAKLPLGCLAVLAA